MGIFDGSFATALVNIINALFNAILTLFGSIFWAFYNMIPVVGAHPLSVPAFFLIMAVAPSAIALYKFRS